MGEDQDQLRREIKKTVNVVNWISEHHKMFVLQV